MNIHKKAIRPSTDGNQSDIVYALRKIGAVVMTGYDDLLVGYRENLHWIEVKKESPFYKRNKNKLRANALRDSQEEILLSGMPYYVVIWSIDGVIDYLHGRDGDYITSEDYKRIVHFKEWGK